MVKSNGAYSDWYSAMNEMTKNFYSSYYGQMRQAWFGDVGDMGDYQLWKSLSEYATYTVMQVNVTNLPFEIRFGLCLPKEWTQEMMTRASNTVTDVLFSVARYAGNLLDIEPIKKYNVGVEFKLTQPDEWLKEHQKKNLSQLLSH